MKKRIISILFSLIILAVNVKAQYPCNILNQTCPTGLSGPYCFTMTYTIPGTLNDCNVAVYYCLGIADNKLTTSLHHFELENPACGVQIGLNNIDFQNHFWDAIINDVYFAHPSIFPPCNANGGPGTLVFEASSYNCLKFINWGNPPTARIEPCVNKEFRCYNYYYVCYDLDSGRVIKTFDHSEPATTPDCPYFDPSTWVPGQGQVWLDYFESECSYWQCLNP